MLTAAILNLIALAYGLHFLRRRPLTGLALTLVGLTGIGAVCLTLAALAIDANAHAIGQARRLADRLAGD